MSGRVHKLLRKTANVMGVSANRLKKGYQNKNRIEKAEVQKGLKESLHLP
jgi:hypothetical protein